MYNQSKDLTILYIMLKLSFDQTLIVIWQKSFSQETFMWIINSFSHIATWKQEIPNSWNSSGETGIRTRDLFAPQAKSLNTRPPPFHWTEKEDQTMDENFQHQLKFLVIRILCVEF